MLIMQAFYKQGDSLISKLGTENQAFFRDLKTVRGVENRLKNFWFADDIVEVRIINLNNPFDENGEILRRILVKNNKIVVDSIF